MSDQLVGAAEVARILGVSRQRVTQLAAEAADFPPSQAVIGAGRTWDRNTIERWAASHPDRGATYRPPRLAPVGTMSRCLGQISRLAADEARLLNHDWVGADHLLLAILHRDCPGAAREVLASFNVSYEEVRKAFIDSMGDPFEDGSQGWVTMPPATQLYFERANLKAVEL